MRRDGLTLRKGGYFTIAVLGILIVAELAGVVYRQHQLGHAANVAVASPTSAASPSQPSTPQPSTSALGSVPSVSSGLSAYASTTTTSTSGSPPTTTIVSQPGIVSYTLPSAAQVQVTFNSTTWMEARTSPTGTLLYTATLSAGATKTFSTPVWIRFGNSQAAEASINGLALKMPPPGPGDLQVTAG